MRTNLCVAIQFSNKNQTKLTNYFIERPPDKALMRFKFGKWRALYVS